MGVYEGNAAGAGGAAAQNEVGEIDTSADVKSPASSAPLNKDTSAVTEGMSSKNTPTGTSKKGRKVVKA